MLVNLLAQDETVTEMWLSNDRVRSKVTPRSLMDSDSTSSFRAAKAWSSGGGSLGGCQRPWALSFQGWAEEKKERLRWRVGRICPFRRICFGAPSLKKAAEPSDSQKYVCVHRLPSSRQAVVLTSGCIYDKKSILKYLLIKTKCLCEFRAGSRATEVRNPVLMFVFFQVIFNPFGRHPRPVSDGSC